jgi:hypothetical protein
MQSITRIRRRRTMLTITEMAAELVTIITMAKTATRKMVMMMKKKKKTKKKVMMTRTTAGEQGSTVAALQLQHPLSHKAGEEGEEG